jgi:branched-chain amino acid transport system ATP-binding protein
MPAGGQDDCLSCRDISVSFGGIAALRGVSITVVPGKILGLIGPNGAGKTTLVNVLTGFQLPAAGSVSIGSVQITGLPPRAFARRGVARTFQSARMFKHLTVLENVAVAPCARGASRKAARRHAAAILDWVELSAKADQPAATLPFGDERRVGIARALAVAPKFLLLDEPAAGLNEQECGHLVGLIRRVPESFGCGVLLIEHNMRVVLNTCPTLHVLDGGKTLASGPSSEVSRNPEVIESYIGVKTKRSARA